MDDVSFLGAAGVALRVLPLRCVLAAALEVFGGPATNPLFRLRFALSEARLTAFASQQLSTPQRKAPAWIGLFPIDSVETVEDQVRLITADCGIVDRCGFVYSPQRPPQRVHEDRFMPLSPGWYRLYQGF